MDLEQLKKDYEISNSYFLSLQEEVLLFLEKIKLKRGDIIDILEVSPRSRKNVKKIDSIIDNIKIKNKYEDCESLFDVKDVAGVRITCYCESDRKILFDILEGELQRAFGKVEKNSKDGPYYAHHFNISKEEIIDGINRKIYCEIQVRTVMGNAWAVQDHKYVFKSINKEGEPVIVTKAIADVMNGLESLWDMLKERKKIEEDDTDKDNIPPYKKFESLAKQVRKIVNEQKKGKESWLFETQKEAFQRFNKTKHSTFMEVKFLLIDNKVSFRNKNLLEAANKSQIHTFGWPIGIMDIGHEQYGPKPKNDGIVMCPVADKNDYFDFWALRQDGTFYLLRSLFEEKRTDNKIFFNTRIIHITESLLYTINLYSNLGINKNSKLRISITHGGLKNRILSSVGNRILYENRPAEENEVQTTIETSIGDIENNLVDNVELFTKPLFEKFDFFELNQKVLEDIVNRYKKGEVS